jgi:hypothetical protein
MQMLKQAAKNATSIFFLRKLTVPNVGLQVMEGVSEPASQN